MSPSFRSTADFFLLLGKTTAYVKGLHYPCGLLLRPSTRLFCLCRFIADNAGFSIFKGLSLSKSSCDRYDKRILPSSIKPSPPAWQCHQACPSMPYWNPNELLDNFQIGRLANCRMTSTRSVKGPPCAGRSNTWLDVFQPSWVWLADDWNNVS